MSVKRWTAVLAAAGAVAGSVLASQSAHGSTVAWSASWGTAQAQAVSVGPWQNQTLRMAVRSSLGGTQVRVHLANTFVTGGASFAHVSVGVQQDGAQTQAVPVSLTFGGSSSVVLGAGASVVSDPTALAVPANSRLLVSLYIPSGANITSAPMHQLPDEEEYNIVGSDAAGLQSPTVSNMFNFTSYVTGVDVGTAAAQTVVAAGDSITDGTSATVDADTRWPDYLADRAASAGFAVVNEGIVNDWVTADQPGNQSLTNRWNRDVLTVPGVRTVIDAAGINDLRGGVSAPTLEAAQNSLIAKAHTLGIRVLLTTVTPCSGATLCTSAFETQRLAYNTWVTSGASTADGWADFSSAVSSPTTPSALSSIYDSGDHIHPGPAGYAVLGNVVSLSEL